MSANRPDADLLVAFDDSDASRRALEFAIERAAKTDESIDVVHVGNSVTEDEIRRLIQDLTVDHGVVVTVDVVPTGGSDDENLSVPARLAAVIEDGDYEILVMGNEKHGLFYNLTEGSVSEAVIERQSIPLLLVP